MARARKSKSSVKVNFKGVESRKTPPEGDYPLEVLEASMGKSGAGNEQIEFVLEISKGEFKGVKLWFYCPLAENSLWKLHAFLTALGEDVPEDEMDIDLADLVGKEVVGILSHETYQGKKRAKMTDFDSIDNYEGDADEEDDEDEDDKKSKKSKSKKSEAKGKSKDDEDEKPAKGKKSKKDDDEDEDEDDGKKSKSKSKSKDKGKKKPKKLDRDEVEEMDEDELQELIDEHDLDVDLEDKKLKKLSKKVAAVIEALEEEELIEEDDD